MSLLEEQDLFYRERVPEQFNRGLEDQRAAARNDPAAARMLEEMEAVRTAIVVQTDSGDALQRHVFEIDRGEMQCVDKSAYAAFLILGHSLEDFPNIRRECGDSLLGFLGGLAGLGDEMRLTSQRVRSLRELHGSVVIEHIGPGGFVLFASFGIETPAPKPQATIRLDEAIYAQLRSGELDPQDAFLGGQIAIEGDMQMAVGLALAVISPD